MSHRSQVAATLAAFTIGNTAITFLVSTAILYIYKYDNGLEVASMVAAGVFLYQVVPTFLLYLLVHKDLSDSSGGG